MDLNQSKPKKVFQWERNFTDIFYFLSLFLSVIFSGIGLFGIWLPWKVLFIFYTSLGSQGSSSVSGILEPQMIRLPSQKQKSWYLNCICLICRYWLLCYILRGLWYTSPFFYHPQSNHSFWLLFLLHGHSDRFFYRNKHVRCPLGSLSKTFLRTLAYAHQRVWAIHYRSRKGQRIERFQSCYIHSI